jgi:hypothetical protein
MTKEERRERHRECMRNRRAEHREELNEYMRRYRAAHPEHIERVHKYQAEHKEECRDRRRKYKDEDLNNSGKKKSHIRLKSRQYLFGRHSKLEGYEVHHCFGYEDFKKFIYIPRQLHKQIHELLRSRKIPSGSNHWMYIRDIVNSCDKYTYISC